MDDHARGWAGRLVDVFGAPLDQVTEVEIERLVSDGVGEQADLDFKAERYGQSDSARRSFAGDIAAMANDRGGVIVVGVRDENDVAVETTPVELVDGEEGRLRQTAAGNLAPHVPFEIFRVPTAADATRGYYLYVVPPSPWRPHAVRKDLDLRFPRRDGSTTRWLAESEVADLYRDRFQLAEAQVDRLPQLLREGASTMDRGQDGSFVEVGLLPAAAAKVRIDAGRVAGLGAWVRELHGPSRAPWLRFFEVGELPRARPRFRRVALTTAPPSEAPKWNLAELHGDGAGFASLWIPAGRKHGEGENEAEMLYGWEILFAVSRCLSLLARYAMDYGGAWGDVMAAARLSSPERMGMAQRDWRWVRPIEGGAILSETPVAEATLPIHSLVGDDRSLLVSSRLLAVELVHAFGAADLEGVSSDGVFSPSVFPDLAQREIKQYAEERGVPIAE